MGLEFGIGVGLVRGEDELDVDRVMVGEQSLHDGLARTSIAHHEFAILGSCWVDRQRRLERMRQRGLCRGHNLGDVLNSLHDLIDEMATDT